MSKQFVAGLRAVEQLLGSKSGSIKRLLVEYKSANPRVNAVVTLAEQHSIEVQSANRGSLTALCDNVRHQGVVAEIRRDTQLDEAGLRTLVEASLTTPGPRPLLLLILDGVEDPHNLGACLRSADGAGVDAVVVPRGGSARLSPAVSKVAAGAAEQIRFATVGNLARVLDWLRKYDIAVVGTSDTAEQSIYKVDLNRPLALVMGAEFTGLRPNIAERCSELVALPMRGVVSSLNISVATGVCLYEALRQRQAEIDL